MAESEAACEQAFFYLSASAVHFDNRCRVVIEICAYGVETVIYRLLFDDIIIDRVHVNFSYLAVGRRTAAAGRLLRRTPETLQECRDRHCCRYFGTCPMG